MTTKGYLTIAENSDRGNYLEMAYCLGMSIKLTQSKVNGISVAVTPGTEIPDHYRKVFDEIIELPWEDDAQGEKFKVHNKWKYIHISPYEETVFLDTDMLFFRDVSGWWDLMAAQDMWFSTNPLTYKGTPFVGDYYRKLFTANDLPDTYNAFAYFKRTQMTYEVFHMVELITHNWEKFEYDYLSEMRPKWFSMDVAFALALKLTGHMEEATNNYYKIPSFIHMKSQGQGWNIQAGKTLSEDWTKYVPVNFTPDLECKIGGYRILEPLHYHLNDFLNPQMISYYEAKFNEKNS